MVNPSRTATAFRGHHRLATGVLQDVARLVKVAIDRDPNDPVLIFDDTTGRRIDLDFSGSLTDVESRIAAPRTPGRPRLGVTAREITLLPSQWTWLNEQPGGASATIRRLIEAERKQSSPNERARRAREAADCFMVAVAGDLQGYEEASRALYRGEQSRFIVETESWPSDIRDHARHLAAAALIG
jgi:uncharacterized protein